eukprot:scaffold331784_cov35-Prasinocladus_malaysianus.AAC.1
MALTAESAILPKNGECHLPDNICSELHILESNLCSAEPIGYTGRMIDKVIMYGSTYQYIMTPERD